MCCELWGLKSFENTSAKLPTAHPLNDRSLILSLLYLSSSLECSLCTAEGGSGLENTSESPENNEKGIEEELYRFLHKWLDSCGPEVVHRRRNHGMGSSGVLLKKINITTVYNYNATKSQL